MTRFKLWRLQNRLTQAQAAANLGLCESTLSLLESGRLRPSEGQRNLLVAAFGPNIEALFEPVRDSVEVAQ